MRAVGAHMAQKQDPILGEADMYRMRIRDQEILTENFFEAALDGFSDMVHCVDHKGDIVFVNQAEVELLGYTQEELLDMSVERLYAPEDLEKMREGFDELKKDGYREVQGILLHKNGTRVPVEIRSFAFYDENWEFLRTVSVLKDLRAIRHAERFAVVGEVAGCIVHDINNLLTPMLGFPELLKGQLAAASQGVERLDFETLSEHLEWFMEASENAGKFLEQIMQTLSGTGQERTRVDLDAILSDVERLLRPRLRRYSVDYHFAPRLDEHFVEGASAQLTRVFMNLVTNASDAMIGSQKRRLEITVASGTGDKKGYWQCEVRDSGIGISEEEAKRLFEIFYTTKEEGTGLGLATCKRTVEDHGGSIEFQSEPGEGTSFFVFLPKAPRSCT